MTKRDEERHVGSMSCPAYAYSSEWPKNYRLHLRHKIDFFMIKRKNGRIINVASITGRAPEANLAVYSASKSAAISFTMALAKQLAHHGITVNAVCPGLVHTRLLEEFVTKSLSKDPEFEELSDTEI